MIGGIKDSAVLDANQNIVQVYPSFDDYLEVGIVTGMTKGQIYIFSAESARIFTCLMLIVQLAQRNFLWPILNASDERLVIDSTRWHDLVIDERLAFVCSEAQRFQIPFRYAYGCLMNWNISNSQDIEDNFRITLEKVGIEMVNESFGEAEVGRLLVNDADMPMLVIRCQVYDAALEAQNRGGFINWEHYCSYQWCRTDNRHVVQLVPTIAVELDNTGQVCNRWLGQEVLANWQPFSRETASEKQHGVRAQIGDLYFVHYNAKRTQIRRWNEFRD